LEPPKKSSTYLRGYASGFFVITLKMLATEPFFTTLLKEARTAPDEFDGDPTTENIRGRSRPKFCIGKLQISYYSQR
jgi:hypothetical protein